MNRDDETVPTERERSGTAAKRRWPHLIAADVRQGVIGGIAWLLAGALGAGLFGVRGDKIPAWILVVVVFIVLLLAVVGVVGTQRRAAALRGALSEARRQTEREKRAATEARARVAEAAQGDMPAPLSPRAQAFIRRIRAL